MLAFHSTKETGCDRSICGADSGEHLRRQLHGSQKTEWLADASVLAMGLYVSREMGSMDMTDDTKIISAISALHERFMEEPTEQGYLHMSDFVFGFRNPEGSFITGSYWDSEPDTNAKIVRYIGAVRDAAHAKFSPKSIAHLETVAKECLS